MFCYILGRKMEAAFLLLPSLVKENQNRIFYSKNNESQMPIEPVIVYKGQDIISAKKYYIYFDKEQFLETTEFLTAVCLWFSTFWIFQIGYTPIITKTLGLIENGLLGIKQTLVSQNVKDVIRRLNGDVKQKPRNVCKRKPN